MVVNVRVTIGLRRQTGGLAVVQAVGETVGEVMKDLIRQFPGLREKILDAEGRPTGHVGIYRDGESVTLLNGMDTPVRDGGEIMLLPAVAGG